MDLLSQKREIFGNIAADKTLTQGLPQLRTTSSMPSVNNDGDTITFLCDLLKTLVGSESLQEILTDTLIYSINDIENEIKKELKRELKSIVSCGVDPSIPDYIKTTGIKFTVKKIDYFGLMFIKPTSEVGQLIYNDLTPNLINSTDFNSFLYQTIQNDGQTQTWPQYAGSTAPILNIKFKSLDSVDPNNTITIKADPNFNGTLTDLNNQFIDSVKIFNTEKLVTQIVDMIFGTISKESQKSTKQLELEEKINTVINKIIKADKDTVIDDSTFEFTNEENKRNEYNASMRKKGEKIFNTSAKLSTDVSLNDVKEMNVNIGNATDELTKKEELTKSLNKMSDGVASKATDKTDQKTLKIGFIQELINFLIQAVVMGILVPKIIAIFLINFKIIYGPNETFNDPIDFLKKNKNLVRTVTKKLAGIIISALLRAVLKEITRLVTEAIKKRAEDKAKSNLKQLLSLIGVSQDVIRKINNL